MDGVRCKFYCRERTETYDSFEKRMLYGYKFSVVTANSEENKKFWAWTPNGTFEVTTVLSGQFEVGKEYYLDISPVPAPEPEIAMAAPTEKK